MDFHEALNAAREASMQGPHSVHGRKGAVYDLLLDSGARFGKAGGMGDVSVFAGIDVFYDESMVPGMVEFRHRDGTVMHRLMQMPDGKWAEIGFGED